MSNEELLVEIIECGRLPKRHDMRSIDLHKIERLLRETDNTAARVAVLKRLLEARR